MPTVEKLNQLYEEADGLATDDMVAEEYAERLSEIEAELELVQADDIAEWVSQFYRKEYRRHHRGERDDPVCSCTNPRCKLKHGELPYALRTRSSQLDYDDRAPAEKLRDYLKEHPEATVIDEALDELREKKRSIAADLRALIREATAERRQQASQQQAGRSA